MKHIPNIITALRILGAICFLFVYPTSVAFWVIYGLCGISDMLDGYLARKLHAESKTGSVLDSVADLCFVACCAIQLIPVVLIPTWLWIWAGVIVAIKIVNQVSALIVCKRLLCSGPLFLLPSLPASPHSPQFRKGGNATKSDK